jgi:hypothetical protein
MNPAEPLAPQLDRIRRQALIAGAAGLLISLIAALISPVALFRSYLVAYMFWVGFSLGCLALLMLHHLVGGAWGFTIRRPLEAGAMTTPIMALLFVPLILGLHDLYPWARTALAHGDEIIRHKGAYLNLAFFIVRAAIDFVLWSGLALLLVRGAEAQDRSPGDPTPTSRLQNLSGPGLVLLFLTGTFAAIDWIMSLEPDWYSTIFGAMIITGQGLSALALMILVASQLAGFRPLSELAKPNQFHDLGNLLLAFVMLWAYMSFSQYLIIWSGNLTEEIPWYLRRSEYGWWWVALALILFHFFLPFFFLLFRETKRDANLLERVAGAVIVMHLVDLVWLVLPSPPVSPVNPLAYVWLVPVAFAGIGGLWLGMFVWQLGKRPLLPQHDPGLAEVLEHVGEA